MDGSAGPASRIIWPCRRHNTKRLFSAMNEPHRNDSPSPSASFFVPDDENDEPQPEPEPPSYRRHNSEHTISSTRPPRFPGDGLDFRRPIMSNGAPAPTSPPADGILIDLTDSDDSQGVGSQTTGSQQSAASAGHSHAQHQLRLPRRLSEFLTSRDSSSHSQNRSPSSDLLHSAVHASRRLRTDPAYPLLPGLRRLPTHSTRDMDELEFVGTRPRSRPPAELSRTPPAPTPRSVTPYPVSIQPSIDLTDDDDVVHLDTRARADVTQPGPPRDDEIRIPQPRPIGFEPHQNLYAGMPLPDYGDPANIPDRVRHYHNPASLWQSRSELLLSDRRRRADRQRQSAHHRGGHQPRVHWEPVRARAFAGHLPPDRLHGLFMDYEMAAFDLGLPGGTARVPSPKYVPPEDAAPGFTRSPGENEIIVCPNCGDELAVGESEAKQEVWVIKGCGHAYCGDCTRSRTKSNAKASKKGKGRAIDLPGPRPFHKCVVDGCNRSAGSKSMVHVFLGS